jgi:di/tricarboxylate transporter
VFSPNFLLVGTLLVLATAGVLSPRDVLAWFSNPTIATIAGLFLVAAGIRTTAEGSEVLSALQRVGGYNASVVAVATAGLLRLPIASPVAGMLMIVTGCVSPARRGGP